MRFVNVVDLMALLPENDHPHGFADSQFDDLFTADEHVVFAFHGYPRAVHQLIHGRSNPGRFHVRGFNEQGTTTTPFDMVVLNRMSRFHLAQEVLRRADGACAGLGRAGAAVRRAGSPSTRPTSASTSRTCPTSRPGPGAEPPHRPKARFASVGTSIYLAGTEARSGKSAVAVGLPGPADPPGRAGGGVPARSSAPGSPTSWSRPCWPSCRAT